MSHINKALVQKTLAMVLAAATAPAVASVSAEQIQALEVRLAQLEADKALSSASDLSGVGLSDRLKINGFMSAGATYLDDDTLVYANGTLSQDVDWRNSITAGLQFDMRINERVSAVTQVLSRGRADFEPEIPLAYISYQSSDNDELRVGRQRLPFFMYSEYLDVGHAYPWARPPMETYGDDFPSAYEGFSWTHNLGAGDWLHDLHIVFGDMHFELPGMDVTVNDHRGASWTSSYADWRLRASYAGSTRATVVAPGLAFFGAAPMNNVDMTFASLGAQYDNGTLMLLSEFFAVEAEGVFPDYESTYLTAGWRFGKLLPTLTLAEIKVTDKSDRTNPALLGQCTGGGPPGPQAACMDDSYPGANDGTLPFPANTLNKLVDGDQQSVTLGLRYDFLPKASVKFDVSAVIDTGDGWGAATPLDSNGDGTNIDEQLSGKPDTPFYLYRLMLDVVF